MAAPLLAVNLALQLLIYDQLFPSKATLYITNDSTSSPNEFPDQTTVHHLRLVCTLIKDEVDHHYAVIARQHYAAFAHTLGVQTEGSDWYE
jgi:hypothetical protein